MSDYTTMITMSVKYMSCRHKNAMFGALNYHDVLLTAGCNYVIT